MILITGNIASGKSSICSKLSKDLNLPLFCMDKMRVIHNPQGHQLGEDAANKAMIKVIQSSKDVIVEAASQYRIRAYSDAYTRAFPGESIHEVRLKINYITTIERVRKRMENGYKWPPTPWGNKKPTIDEVMAVHDNIDKQHSFAKLKLDTTNITANQVIKLIRIYYGF